MKRIFYCGAYLFLSLVSSCSSVSGDEPKKANPTPPRMTMAVEGFVAQEQRLESIVNATGSLLPNELVQISPERAGKLIHLPLKESTFVKKGTMLAKIDDQELQAQLNKLNVQLRMAAKEAERGRDLRKIEAIPLEELERLENAQEQLEADISLTEVLLEKTNIRAPFSGLLGLRNVSLGAYVTPSESIVSLQQINPLKVEFDVPEKYMQQVNIGQKVTFEVVGFSEPFVASIYATSANVTPSTRTFKVLARCANPGGRLKPGNFAKVEVITGVNEHAIMLPSDAVIPVISGQKVFVAEGGKVSERLVETGMREGTMIEIISGVQVQDTVIVSGLLALSEGMNVTVSEIVSYSTHLN